MDTVRPLPLFLGVNGTGPSAFCFSPTAFAPPTRHLDKTAPEKVSSRLALNSKYFLSNYALLAAGVGIVVALLHPGMLLNLGCLWGLWFFHHKSTTLGDDMPKVFGKDINQVVSPEIRGTILKILTILVIVMQCLGPFLSVVFLSGFLIFLHAILRDPKDVMAARNNPSYLHARGTGSPDSDDEDAECGGAGSDSTDEDSRVLVNRKDAMMSR
jgi:hypothetical protein